MPTATVSDTWDAGRKVFPHELTPGFAWTASPPVISQGVDPGSSLYRVYIFTDSHCVNRVFTGSIVGSPAFAPRTIGGPMALPGTTSVLTLAESAPEPCAMTGTLFRSPQVLSCSTAAARNVSPAASTTERRSFV